ncbi:hypothetical protein AB0K09_25335 [Streptomyces sp. NPDC049577]|uniref:hypothetical protein n=1 Tax=Streptomyces sp. NPDC049577 TaxID=3155153 RepID=UPI00343FAC53
MNERRERRRVRTLEQLLAPPDPYAGRGLMLVRALADRWDFFPLARDAYGAPSKAVWCEIDRRPATRVGDGPSRAPEAER